MLNVLHMTTQNRSSEVLISRLAKLDLVGNLSQSNRHANIEAFNGTCLCQIKSVSEHYGGCS